MLDAWHTLPPDTRTAILAIVEATRVLTEDLSSGFRKFVQVEDERPLVLAEALSCCVIESGEASSAY